MLYPWKFSKILTTPKIKTKTKTSILEEEKAGLLIPAFDIKTKGVNIEEIVAAKQHVKGFESAKE